MQKSSSFTFLNKNSTFFSFPTQKSLINLYERVENGSTDSINSDMDKRFYGAQKRLLGIIHATQLGSEGSKKSSNVIKTQRYDFALESVGGSIVSYHNTKLLYDCSSYFLLLGKCNKISPPEKAIQSTVIPGEAFCFEGNQGSITIKLSCDVFIDSITIDHVERPMTPKFNFSDAPKSFSVTVNHS